MHIGVHIFLLHAVHILPTALQIGVHTFLLIHVQRLPIYVQIALIKLHIAFKAVHNNLHILRQHSQILFNTGHIHLLHISLQTSATLLHIPVQHG